MRKLPALVVAAGLLVSLAACATGPTTFATCDTTGNAALVKVSGSLKGDPKASFPTPLVAKKAELAVAEDGKGAHVPSDGAVDIFVSIYDGKTGDPVQDTSGPLTAVNIRSFVNGSFPFTKALSCASKGSRVVTTGTAAQLFGAQALGLDPKSTLVVVTDVNDVYLGKANGVDQLPPGGLPAIVLAPNGEPGFTFPSKVAPTTLRIALLKAGNGAKVAEGDNVVLNYSGVLWAGTELFDSSWKNAAPATLAAKPISADGSGLVPGFAKAIIGQKVGSQVIVVIPPGKYGYAAGSAPASIPDGSTMVFVIDILGIAK